MTQPTIPLTGAPAGVLPALRAENTANDSMRSRYGWAFAWLVKDAWPEGADLDWDQTIQRLRAGVTVETRCGTQTHRLVLHPDGTITMLDHPNTTHPPGGHSADLDLTTEMFMHALGATVPACLGYVLWLQGEQVNPANAHLFDQTFRKTCGLSYYSARSNVRILYAAVAWAQHTNPDGTWCWPAGAWANYLHIGLTPRALSYWVQAGWTVPEALAFLQAGAPFDIAQLWKRAGDTSGRAAKFAGRQQTPADDLPWAAAGFDPVDADRWRNFDATRANKTTPERAWAWHCDGVLPRWVNEFEELPKTDHEARQRGVRRSFYTYPDPTWDQAIAWTRAGVPCDVVLAWYRHHAEDLDTVLAWCRQGLTVADYAKVAAWNQEHPEAPLTPPRVKALRRLGVPLARMGQLTAAEVSTEDILRPLNMLGAGRRWLGIEARQVFVTFIDEQCDASSVSSKDGEPAREWANLRDKIRAGQWEAVTSQMRQRFGFPSSLWIPYTDWLCTHPTPPGR